MRMRAFSLLLVLAIVLLGAFATLNWAAMSTPVTLNLGFAEAFAPLGTAMLAFMAAIAGLFIVYIVLLQAGVILDARRMTKEIATQRDLAQVAEASRFTALQTLLEGDARRLEALALASSRQFNLRIDQADSAVQDRISDAVGSLSAHLGEVEDKLDQVLAAWRATGAAPTPASRQG